MAIIFITIVLVVALVLAIVYLVVTSKKLAKYKEADATIAKLKKDLNSAKGARDKVMCDYNTLRDRIVVLEDEIPKNETPKYLGMKFQNEVAPYIKKKGGKLTLTVLK